MGVIRTCKIYSCKGFTWSAVFQFELRGPFVSHLASDLDTNEIPGFLEQKDVVWYYFDYRWELEGYDSPEEVGKMKPLKL